MVMKYLFIVQGEGRGHLTQAITLEKLLISRGHEVVGIMVGKSRGRKLPDFFGREVHAPVTQFESMNFLPSASNRRPSMLKTVAVNAVSLHKYIPSIRMIRDTIRSSGADAVVNFYELMTGLTCMFCRIDVPVVCIGHQYLFRHSDFGMPYKKYPGSRALNFFTKLTCAGAVKCLALSFRKMDADYAHGIAVVPPLLRREVMDMEVADGDYVHGYMLNKGFSKDVLEWHREHPEVELRFFWDNWEAGKVMKVDDTLSFYLIDDHEFLKQMAGCRAYASTAGFESICEAIWMGKPILMVPSHIEQEINAFDASRSGAGVSCDKFDLSLLLDFADGFKAEPGFRDWARSAQDIFIRELEDLDKIA